MPLKSSMSLSSANKQARLAIKFIALYQVLARFKLTRQIKILFHEIGTAHAAQIGQLLLQSNETRVAGIDLNETETVRVK